MIIPKLLPAVYSVLWLYLLLSFLGRAYAALRYGFKLSAYPQDVLKSYIPSDNYLFGLDPQGRLFLGGGQETAYFGEPGGPNATLVMQGDGNLVLYKSPSGEVAFASDTNGNHGAQLDLDDHDGFAKIIAIDGDILKVFRPKGCVGTILQATEKLYPGENICHAGNRFGLTSEGLVENFRWGTIRTYESQSGPAKYLLMQRDGNLVAYAQDGTPVWSSGTHGNPVTALYIEGSPRIVDSGGNTIWETSVDCSWYFHGMSDEELWNRATNGKRIGQHCYIFGPTRESDNPSCCACNYYVKGKPSGNYNGVPLTRDGRGTGCVKDDDSSFCYYKDEGYDLYTSQRNEMCTSSVIANAAAQLRYGIRNGLCVDDGKQLDCP